jgi:hypothetical protein
MKCSTATLTVAVETGGQVPLLVIFAPHWLRFTESTQFPIPYQCEIMIGVVGYFLTISKSKVFAADLKQYLARL